MHMADALLSPAVAGTMYAATAAAAAVCVKKIKADDRPAAEKLPLMAVSSALVFAGQMINFTIPGTGSSGHICGGMLLSALLGSEAGFLSMIAVLAIQCLFFADGGLLALGANIWNMAFYGCFVGYYLLYRPIMHSRLAPRAKVTLASVLGCTVSLQLGAFSVVLETSLSGVTDLPFGAFLGLMQPIHLAIGLVEGLITAAVLAFVQEARPELLRENAPGRSGRMSLKAVVAVLAVSAAVIGGGLSLLASSNPDGLEWSLFGNADAGYSANLGLDEEHYGVESEAAEAAAAVQERTAFLPDYGFASGESAAGTSVSGLLGSALAALAAAGVYMAGGALRRKRAAAAE